MWPTSMVVAGISCPKPSDRHPMRPVLVTVSPQMTAAHLGPVIDSTLGRANQCPVPGLQRELRREGIRAGDAAHTSLEQADRSESKAVH